MIFITSHKVCPFAIHKSPEDQISAFSLTLVPHKCKGIDIIWASVHKWEYILYQIQSEYLLALQLLWKLEIILWKCFQLLANFISDWLFLFTKSANQSRSLWVYPNYWHSFNEYNWRMLPSLLTVWQLA